MLTNPYTPPNSELADQARPPGSPLKAILLGLTIDLGGSLIVGIVLGIVYAISLARAGMDPSQIKEAVSHISSTSWVSIVGTVVGGALSILGGFTCARVSRRDDYKLGYILGAISAVSGLLLSYSSHSLLINVLLTVFTFGAVLLGTKLGLGEQ